MNHSCFNILTICFTPKEIDAENKKHIPEFEIVYEPDFRQAIAESWPASLDDSVARDELSWTPDYDLAAMTKDMCEKPSKKPGIKY